MTLRSIDQAVADLRAIADPYSRLREADSLDAALVAARSVVAQIKRDTIGTLRGKAAGYGTIAQRLGLSKARVQQLANAPRKPVLAAYAFRDEDGRWHGAPTLLAPGSFREAPSSIPFSPADKYNPLAGQVLAVRYGDVGEERWASVYTLQIRREDGSLLNLRMTHPVQDALFGPPDTSTPEWQQWEAARQRRERELDGKS